MTVLKSHRDFFSWAGKGWCLLERGLTDSCDGDGLHLYQKFPGAGKEG